MLLFGKALALIFLFFSVVTAYAQAPTIQQTVNRAIQTAVAPFIPKLKPLAQADQTLPADVQAAIETLARQEIKQEQAIATLPFIVPSETNKENVFQSIGFTVEEVFTKGPIDQAKLRIKKIDRLILRLQRRLAQDTSAQAIRNAANLIEEIGAETDKIVADPETQTDREVLTLQIEQYNRLQLIIQQLEDRLPFHDYLTLEDARKKYLVSTAVKSINTAANLDAIHSIAVPVVANFVGDDLAELKALEIVTDIEDDLAPVARQKLFVLEKQLATAFEKKILKLPRDVRNRKLQSYIHYSYGDPLLQVRVFEHMKDTLSDRELITSVESLQEVAIEQLAHRLFELDNQADIDLYLDRIIKHPQDIKVLGEVQMVVESSGDAERIALFTKLQEGMQRRIITFLQSANSEQLETFLRPVEEIPTRLIDVILVDNLEELVATSPELSTEVKLRLKEVKQKIRDRFIAQVIDKAFLTQPKLSYNPVSASADVRILLSHPQGIARLQDLRSQVTARQRTAIDTAIRASSAITVDHILFQINDPRIFTEYQQFISKNSSVNQTLRIYGGRNFDENLAKKAEVIQKVATAEKQQLYEVMQQISQSIFAQRNETQFEKQLLPEIVTEIRSLKRSLPARNIPQLTVPEGVTLSPVAILPHDVQHAIVQAAKVRLRDSQKSEAVKLDITVSAADLGIYQPRVLPGSFWYPLKQFTRRVQLLLTFDGISRAELLVKHNNERTLEAALLLEKSSARRNIDLALQTLADVQANFDLLKKATDKEKVRVLRQQQPQKLDRLINAIIQNGLARQTIFASIEDNVYGADYVRVEKIRQQVLRDGIDTLLQLSDDNAQLLVERLEQAVASGSSSQFKELKAIELLTEIKRFQPERIGQILSASEIRLVKTFEAKLLAIDKEERERELLAYAAGLPGNPIRQYEAYEDLRDSFENKETVALVNQLQDKAIHNLVEIVSGITDEVTLQEFATEVVGTEPQDLKIVVEAESQVQTHDTLDSIHTPIEQAIEEIKTIVEQEIVQEFIEDPISLTESDLFADESNQGSTSVTDVEVIQDLVEIIEQTPEATPELIETVEKLQQEVISDFIETVITNPTQALEPAPQVIETLVELKDEVPSSLDTQIDQAIQAEVEIIQEQLQSEVTSPETLETYISQIEASPVVSEIVAEVGGSEFQQVLEETTTEVSQNLTQEHTLLQETIEQVQEEIFSAPVYSPSPVEETLPQTIQTEIEQIKTEVATEEIPTVTTTTETTVTIESVQTSTETQIEIAPTTSTPIEPQTTTTVEQSAPAPTIESAPSAPAPVQEAPAPAVGL